MCKIENLYQTSNYENEISHEAYIEQILGELEKDCNHTSSCFCDYCDLVQRLANIDGVCDWRLMPSNIQSQAIDSNAPEEGANSIQQQNVGFDDDEADALMDLKFDMSHYRVDSSQNVMLGDYLNRPVQIHTETWTIGNTIDAATGQFKPWHLFFNHTSIKKKLDNYYMVRGNLHIKAVVNSSPFYYGMLLASYQPLTNFNPAPVVLGAARQEVSQLSQRPHIWIYPQDSQAGEMVLPFLYHKNWLDATSSTDLQDMGTITQISVDQLRNANGLTTDSISIVYYAWMEDVEVAGPTVALAVQSSKRKKQSNKPHRDDEYKDDGVVSKPASAIARAAGYLTDIPVIGPFATATQLAADAVSNIASLFGFTNTPVIDDIHSFRPNPYPNLAATDIGMPIDKLTLDAKNELSVDPSIAGVKIDDELAITNIVQRESYIAHYAWSSADSIDTGLFYSKVSPRMFLTATGSFSTAQYSTPMAHVSELFTYWRGDIIFRFKFICSKYHRGRVRINWDPHGDIGTSGNYTTETYTRIVDITEETDVEVRVPYTQPISFLEMDTRNTHFAQSSSSISGVGVTQNGILTMRVLNQQTSPVSSADIDVVVFVRGAENLEFACPNNVAADLSPYTIQSKPFDKTVEEKAIGVSKSVADDNLNLLHMGEHVTSLRQLMRRQTYYRTLTSTGPANVSDYKKVSHYLSRNPLYPGFDTDGIDSATGLSSGITESYNWVNWSPLTYMSLCFVGVRGSYIYTLNVRGHQSSNFVVIDRKRNSHTSSNATLTTTLSTLPTLTSNFVTSNESLLYGATLTNQTTQTGVSALLPMYSPYKFMMNSVLYRTEGNAGDQSDEDSIHIMHIHSSDNATEQNVPADLFVSAGTDFSLIFFLNTPCLYEYNSYPTPV